MALRSLPERSINVRSYARGGPRAVRSSTPSDPRPRRLRTYVGWGRRASLQSWNATVDVRDGGVSGVAFGDLIEFSPGDTPRYVEKPGTAAFPRGAGIRALRQSTVSSPRIISNPLCGSSSMLHPLRRGVQPAGPHDHWGARRVRCSAAAPPVHWPNHFSRFLGDKAFGLLVAWAIELPVPDTTVVSRTVPPVRFGRRTGSAETWLRTAPEGTGPGKFPTRRGWTDPFRLLATERSLPAPTLSPSWRRRASTPSTRRAANDCRRRGPDRGRKGLGEDFMLGAASPESLPAKVDEAVRRLWRAATFQHSDR